MEGRRCTLPVRDPSLPRAACLMERAEASAGGGGGAEAASGEGLASVRQHSAQFHAGQPQRASSPACHPCSESGGWLAGGAVCACATVGKLSCFKFGDRTRIQRRMCCNQAKQMLLKWAGRWMGRIGMLHGIGAYVRSPVSCAHGLICWHNSFLEFNAI